jgi:hypothetical protein
MSWSHVTLTYPCTSWAELREYLIMIFPVSSHLHHVYSAHDLCEPRVHTVGAAAANRRINHPSINNAYVSQRSDIRAR